MTKRILEIWKAGFINGFSILANGDAASELRLGLLSEPDLDARISVHLNLCEGKSLIEPRDIPLLADSRGNLKQSFAGLLFLWITSSKMKKNALLRQIEKEWRAQITEVKRICCPRKITAVDSHINIHMLPFLFPLAVKLAKEEGIAEIRILYEVFYFSSCLVDSLSMGFLVNIVKHLILRQCSSSARRFAKEHGMGGPEALVGILYTGRMTRTAAKSGIAAAMRKGLQVVEVVFHIGRASGSESSRWKHHPSLGTFPLSERRDREYFELMALRKEM
jgi:hypothetical protein